jgi:hypothetical protein
MSDSSQRGGRSIAIIIGAAALLILVVVYAAIAALFGFLLLASTLTMDRVGETSMNLDFRGATIVHIGEIRLSSEFSLIGLLIFGLLCLLSAYGGLASIWRWPRSVWVARAAGWATVALGIYGGWTFLIMIAPGLPHPPFAIGVMMPIHVAIAAGLIGTLVLLVMRKPAAGTLDPKFCCCAAILAWQPGRRPVSRG